MDPSKRAGRALQVGRVIPSRRLDEGHVADAFDIDVARPVTHDQDFENGSGGDGQCSGKIDRETLSVRAVRSFREQGSEADPAFMTLSDQIEYRIHLAVSVEAFDGRSCATIMDLLTYLHGRR